MRLVCQTQSMIKIFKFSKLKKRSKEKLHQDYVYVVGNDGNPLMPTKKFGMVRWMLKTGKATVLRRQPFTIRLNYESTHYVQHVSVSMDTGYAHMAVSASTETAELYSS